MRVSRLVMPAVLALGALGVTSGSAVAADPDPDVRSFPGGMTCVGSTVSGVARISSTRFTSGRIELRHNSGGKVFQKVIGGKDLIVKKGIFDYPFSFDISSAPAGTSQYLGYATAGEPPAVDSVQSKVLAAADCAPVDADKTAPTTEISLPSSATGWYADSVPVTLTATDTGSGVAKTYYRVDDGPAKEWTGALSHSAAGAHTISYWSVDVAGNVESAKTREVKVDTATPTIAGTVTPAANDLGWHNTDVDVSFTCNDADSGVPAGGCTPGTPVLNEGANQSVHGAATDNVGKAARVKVDGINIDKTRPTLTAVRKTPPNAAGWNNGNVTVGWSATDPLSGIDPVSQPSDSVVTGEGSDLGATASVMDRAGNTGTGSINGIKIDRTRPTVSGAIVTNDGSARPANAAGWFKSSVRVRYSASDSLSGVQETSEDTVLLEDGADQSATGTATDNAGNASSATLTGINIDSQAPQTTANNVCDEGNGWCRGESATVTLTAQDQRGLSGVKEIRYVVNGGVEQVAAGASANVRVPLAAATGEATVDYYAVDVAGNVEARGGVSLKYDNIAPSVTSTVNPSSNAAGWNNSDMTVHFDATDDDGGSGVDPATVTPDVTVTEETSATGVVVNGSAADLAGNTGTSSVSVRLDKTAPQVSAAVKVGTKGANGYYTGPVTVGFQCSDTLSGIATCPADVVLDEDGSGQKVTGEAVDTAGNTASATASGISIDSTNPVITVAGAKASYTLGENTGITCTATDASSGVDGNGCKITVTGGTPNGVGTFTYTATATDRASNVARVTGTYRVLYDWSGFLQPVNDTAHGVGNGVSVFKGGSTVSVKFELRNAGGQPVPGAVAQWLTPAKGGAVTAPVDESRFSAPAASGATYRYDATARQYVYNWSTKNVATGYFHRVGVRLDNGQTYFATIALR